MMNQENIKVHVYRWWWWLRPRIWYLAPATILFIVMCQIMVSIMHYNGMLNTDTQSFIPYPEIVKPHIVENQVNQYDPQQGVAFAIPVGGRTERSEQLGRILETLISGGALPSNIFVFEDVLSRWDGKGSVPVKAVADKHGVKVVASRVDRSRPEDGSNFGIGLARHYHFFLDYMFADASVPNVVERVDREAPFDFAAIIEDDLELSPDITKYFFSMARVMLADPTLYCAAAHQDNAFLGIHRDDAFDPMTHRATQLSADGFDFRRGNHFMAPGWMTSRSVYIDTVRPKWLGPDLEYSHKRELHLRNGHWDRFFDSMIGDRDCIFPEIPRITHQGADGFTVSKRGQMELYSNLRLSQLPVSVDYGDLSRMTHAGYIAETEAFILGATRLHVLEQARSHRHANLVYVVDSRDDKDEEWNAVFNHYFGLIGVGGYGGYEGYVKVRGIFRGAVFVRWMTNLIVLVGAYSPYMEQVKQLRIDSASQRVSFLGCYKDDWQRDLPFQLSYYSSRSLTPSKCVASCQASGYKYAGLQKHECWCGTSFGKYDKVDDSECSSSCGQSGLLSSLLPSTVTTTGTQSDSCGGGWRNSVYTSSPEAEVSLSPPSEVKYVHSKTGESCDDACKRDGGDKQRCDERYFPLIHRSCSTLSSIFGTQCAQCVDEEDPERGFATPSMDQSTSACYMSRARYHRCNWPAQSHLSRACTCVA